MGEQGGDGRQSALIRGCTDVASVSCGQNSGGTFGAGVALGLHSSRVGSTGGREVFPVRLVVDGVRSSRASVASARGIRHMAGYRKHRANISCATQIKGGMEPCESRFTRSGMYRVVTVRGCRAEHEGDTQHFRDPSRVSPGCPVINNLSTRQMFREQGPPPQSR